MNPDLWLYWAARLVERGLSVMPIGEDKIPAIKWRDLQERLPTEEELLSWPRHNLGIITGSISGIVVVDCESREDAEWFHRERGQSDVMVKTKRGFHFYFSHPGGRVGNAQRVEGRYDIRGDGGYVMAPPSVHSDGSYSWVRDQVGMVGQCLPNFDPAWSPPPADDFQSDKKIRDGVAYISKIKAISGQGGHDDTYRAAKTLHESGLSEGEALLAMLDWNETNADPQWSRRELLHKIKSAFGS